jgi:hypothetical protein
MKLCSLSKTMTVCSTNIRPRILQDLNLAEEASSERKAIDLHESKFEVEPFIKSLNLPNSRK